MICWLKVVILKVVLRSGFMDKMQLSLVGTGSFSAPCKCFIHVTYSRKWVSLQCVTQASWFASFKL